MAQNIPHTSHLSFTVHPVGDGPTAIIFTVHDDAIHVVFSQGADGERQGEAVFGFDQIIEFVEQQSWPSDVFGAVEPKEGP